MVSLLVSFASVQPRPDEDADGPGSGATDAHGGR